MDDLPAVWMAGFIPACQHSASLACRIMEPLLPHFSTACMGAFTTHPVGLLTSLNPAQRALVLLLSKPSLQILF